MVPSNPETQPSPHVKGMKNQLLKVVAVPLLAFTPGLSSGHNMQPLPVAEGPFQPSWQSLKQYRTPEWFRDAKFGIWSFWTAQSVPEQGDWYARRMYQQQGKDKWEKAGYQFHTNHYGHPSKFGFKDIDNLWHAEKWDPEELTGLFKKAGAKYLVATANHHDNLDCYDSTYQEWNTLRVGPKKDIVGGWAKAARAAGLRFGAYVGASRTWSWFDVAHEADKDGPLAGVPYDGNLTKADGQGQWWGGLDPAELYGPAGKARTREARLVYNQKFVNRQLDLINKYQMDIIFFDDWVLPLSDTGEEDGLKIAAHHYNSSIRWHGWNEAVVLIKDGREVMNADQRKSLTLDIEAGRAEDIRPYAWQCDSTIGDWQYVRWTFEHHNYKKVADVVPMLADIVSKNGNLLLDVPQRADGTIDSDEIAFLEDFGKWMAINGEGIYATRPWKIYGEGPSTTAKQEKADFSGVKDFTGKPYTAEDVRFTTSKDGKTLYAIALGWPADGKLVIKSLAEGSPQDLGEIRALTLLGSSHKLSFRRDRQGLVVELPAAKPCDYAWVFAIKLK